MQKRYPRLELFLCLTGFLYVLGCQGTVGGAQDTVGPDRSVGGPLDSSSPRPGDPQTPADPHHPSGDPEPVVRELLTCDEMTRGGLAPRLVRLTEVQYRNTVAAALGVNAEQLQNLPFGLVNKADRFSTRSRSYRVGEADIDGVMAAARQVAEQASSAWMAETPCLSDGSALSACLRNELADRGGRLFHRPLTDDELNAYVGLAEALEISLGRESAVSAALEAMLRAPQFLFRSELGTPSEDGRPTLTAYELASAISYRLTDAPPDEALWAAAQSGALLAPTEIERQVQRLLSSPNTNEAVRRFVREYIPYEAATDIGKDEGAYPFHDAAGLVSDTERFVQGVLEQQGRSGFLEALLTSETLYLQPETSASYGMEALETTEGARPDERIGILMQPSFLVAFSEPTKNQPIQRGKFIRETFLCDELPELPIPDIEPLSPTEDQTLRETLAEHRQNAACAGCHDRMDPLGLPFEQFDHLGRYRTLEKDRPVDTTGALDASGPSTDGPVDGPKALVQNMADSEVVRQCFVRHASEYWWGAGPEDAWGCALLRVDGAFSENQDVVTLIAGLFSSEAFRVRSEEIL